MPVPAPRVPLDLSAAFARFRNAAPERLHFAAHSHHFWPDVARDAQIKAWDDAHKLNKDTRSTLNRMEFENYDRTKAKIDQVRGQSQKLTRAAG